jgi:hypothetical protein
LGKNLCSTRLRILTNAGKWSNCRAKNKRGSKVLNIAVFCGIVLHRWEHFTLFVPIIFLFFLFETQSFRVEIVGKSWFTVGYVELREAAGPRVGRTAPFRIDFRIVEQWLTARSCNQLAKESDLAQPFSDFDVQLEGVRRYVWSDPGRVTDA